MSEFIDTNKIGLVFSTGKVSKDILYQILINRDLFEIYMPLSVLDYYSLKGLVADFYLSTEITQKEVYQLRTSKSHKRAMLLVSTTANYLLCRTWKGQVIFFTPFDNKDKEIPLLTHAKLSYFRDLAGMEYDRYVDLMLLKLLTTSIQYAATFMLGFEVIDKDLSLSNLTQEELRR